MSTAALLALGLAGLVGAAALAHDALPFVDESCSSLDPERLVGWLEDATRRALDAHAKDPSPLTLAMGPVEGMRRLRAYVVAAWEGMPCAPTSSAAAAEAWRLLGCSVVLELIRRGVLDDEVEDIEAACFAGATLVDWRPPVDEPIGQQPRVIEMILTEDGLWLDAAGQLQEPFSDVHVCTGDLLVIRTPPQPDPNAAFTLMQPMVSWLVLELDTWQSGDFAWRVGPVIADDGLVRVRVGVDVRFVGQLGFRVRRATACPA